MRRSTVESIWSTNSSGSGPGGLSWAPGLPSSANLPMQPPSGRNSFGPYLPDQSTFEVPHPNGFELQNTLEMPHLTQYDLNIRRHSVGDVFGSAATHDEVSTTMDNITRYFDSDPHERVKVTLAFLENRFYDEEKYLGEAYQLPKFPVENLLRNYQLVLVGFKAGRIDVFYLPSTNAEASTLKKGDLVIVEADRGRDLGKIVKMNISIDEARLMKLLHFQEQQVALHETTNTLSVKEMQNPPSLHFPKLIIGLASPSEILQVLNKKLDEEKACRLCIAKISNNHHGHNADLAQMKLIDAEYQFDRKKLIFYYATHKRIDFRDLVRELFRIYKTRIWMCAVTGIPYVPQRLRHNSQSKRSPITQPALPGQLPISRRRLGPAVLTSDFDPLVPTPVGMQPPPWAVPRQLADTPETIRLELYVLQSLVDSINH